MILDQSIGQGLAGLALLSLENWNCLVRREGHAYDSLIVGINAVHIQ